VTAPPSRPHESASPPRKRGSIAIAVDSRLRGNDKGWALLQCSFRVDSRFRGNDVVRAVTRRWAVITLEERQVTAPLCHPRESTSPPRKRGSIAIAVDSRLRGDDKGRELVQCLSAVDSRFRGNDVVRAVTRRWAVLTLVEATSDGPAESPPRKRVTPAKAGVHCHRRGFPLTRE
jgi:hypothetical protein